MSALVEDLESVTAAAADLEAAMTDARTASRAESTAANHLKGANTTVRQNKYLSALVNLRQARNDLGQSIATATAEASSIARMLRYEMTPEIAVQVATLIAQLPVQIDAAQELADRLNEAEQRPFLHDLLAARLATVTSNSMFAVDRETMKRLTLLMTEGGTAILKEKDFPRPNPESKYRRGTVKWYNPTKGYGFIQPADGTKDVFVHINDVERAGLSTLNEGQRIEYELFSQRGKERAVNLRVV